MKIKLIKFDNFKEPVRAHYNDSGADIFAAETVVIPAGKVCRVRTGVGVELPDGYDIVIHRKSGLSSSGIFMANAPIDSGYRGEILGVMYNTTDKDYIVEQGTKIGQMVVRPVIYADFVEGLDNNRGSNGFGSTGMV